ncbi:hypothetical protein [Halomonas sp.]|uniref:hypothetical protein n=1 Tax=Halomonas sp. TaxID=1486246 RepID=UPI0025803301|nr:hypothetical protein [Halomonas sp.]|tara:strand:- start:8948 stop:10729 length:1782 start_codon:yes stop_codon:yes gene_type:complete
MAFQRREKRKVSPAKPSYGSNVININLKDKAITDGHGTANFERLLYKGCPILPMDGRRAWAPKNQTEIVDAGRKEIVIKICNAIHSMDKTERTKINTFNEVVRYIRLLEKNGVEEIFCRESLSLYVNDLAAKYISGTKGKSLQSRQNSIKALLFEIDAELYEQCKKSFMSFPSDTTSVSPYSDDELKKIISNLFTMYDNYAAHLENNTKPEAFPLYKAERRDCYETNDAHTLRRTVSYRTNSSIWKSDLVRTAYYITCFYTGVNSTPLLDLKTSDLSEEPFKDITRRAYKLKTYKGRQSGKKNEINIGFTKKAKVFFERWIKISKKLNGYEDGYVFPNIINDKPSKMTSTNISKLNKYLAQLEIPALSSQRFRKTKATLIMRATESILMVAQGLNNSVETAAKHYADGDAVTTEVSLASALYIREQTALGKPLETAVKESSFIFRDPVKESNIGNRFKKLSNGLRCGGTYKEKSIKIKNALVKEGIASTDDPVACHKFLECFGCMHHAVVAEKDDIWLLLSFQDVILESINRPSVNSKPTSLLGKVDYTLQVIIENMKSDHKAVYDEAYQQYLEAPHPLWQDIDDIELVLGAY